MSPVRFLVAPQKKDLRNCFGGLFVCTFSTLIRVSPAALCADAFGTILTRKRWYSCRLYFLWLFLDREKKLKKKELHARWNSLHPFLSADIATKPIRALFFYKGMNFILFYKLNLNFSAIFNNSIGVFISLRLH